ncbi:MAG TPA: M24 family metallopeptidase [Thermoanaerobaculia bacterium]|jgi:Xaa-Pro aminopeptidase|nr:M24 family metallopeptidase [Thermoanaerobaculia bacterium]
MAREGELDRGLAALGCHALLVIAASARDPDLAPFVGPVHVHSAFLVAPRRGQPSLGYLSPMERDEAARSGLKLLTPEALDVARWARQGEAEEVMLANVLERALLLAGVAPGMRLALAGHAGVGLVQSVCAALAASGWTFVPGHHLLLEVRKGKTEAELEAVRSAAAGAVAAMRAVAGLLAAAAVVAGELRLEGEPLRVARLRREVASVLALHGLGQPEGNIVAAGAEGGVPHTAGDDERVLRAGESLVVDLYPKGELFADCTRTFCVGAPPAALVEAHQAVQAALAAAHAAALPGVRGWTLQEAACAQLAGRGWPTPISQPGTTRGYVHGLGHGVGFELHEYPSFRRHAGAEGVLGMGDVFTLEPGLYEPKAGFGVRLEDLVTLGAGGPETLTPLPYALDPRAW